MRSSSHEAPAPARTAVLFSGTAAPPTNKRMRVSSAINQAETKHAALGSALKPIVVHDGSSSKTVTRKGLTEEQQRIVSAFLEFLTLEEQTKFHSLNKDEQIKYLNNYNKKNKPQPQQQLAHIWKGTIVWNEPNTNKTLPSQPSQIEKTLFALAIITQNKRNPKSVGFHFDSDQWASQLIPTSLTPVDTVSSHFPVGGLVELQPFAPQEKKTLNDSHYSYLVTTLERKSMALTAQAGPAAVIYIFSRSPRLFGLVVKRDMLTRLEMTRNKSDGMIVDTKRPVHRSVVAPAPPQMNQFRHNITHSNVFSPSNSLAAPTGSFPVSTTSAAAPPMMQGSPHGRASSSTPTAAPATPIAAAAAAAAAFVNAQPPTPIATAAPLLQGRPRPVPSANFGLEEHEDDYSSFLELL